MYVIRTLNFVYLSLFLDMFPQLEPRGPLANEMSQHIYTTYVSGILGLGGEQGCRSQRRQNTTENFNIGCQIVLKYTQASIVYIYKIISCRRG